MSAILRCFLSFFAIIGIFSAANVDAEVIYKGSVAVNNYNAPVFNNSGNITNTNLNISGSSIEIKNSPGDSTIRHAKESKEDSEKKLSSSQNKDSAAKLSAVNSSYKSNINKSILPDVKVGDTLKFGRYDNKDIEWSVIDITNQTALLLSTDIIGTSTYSDIEESLKNSEKVAGIGKKIFLLTVEQYKKLKKSIQGLEKIWWLKDNQCLGTEDNPKTDACAINTQGDISTIYKKNNVGIRPAIKISTDYVKKLKGN